MFLQEINIRPETTPSWFSSRITSLVQVAMIAAVALVLSACNQHAVEGGGENSSNAMPTIHILSPDSGAEWTEENLVLKVRIENFAVDPNGVGMPNIAGTGHWHISLNGVWVGLSVNDEFVLEGVPKGPHHLMVSLANNDHWAVAPLAEDSIVIDKVSGDDPLEGVVGSNESIYSSLDDTSAAQLPASVEPLHFVSSTPAHGEELYDAEEAIALTFDFNLAPESTIELTRNGVSITLGPLVISEDKYSMSAAVAEAMSEGVYEVSYQACWPFLNCHQGSFAFVVETEQPPIMDY